MATPNVECPQCGYEIATFTEAVEALEGGSCCLLCGSALDKSRLEEAVDAWEDDPIFREGAEKADAEKSVPDDDLFEGVPDFGDEGEDDPLF